MLSSVCRHRLCCNCGTAPECFLAAQKRYWFRDAAAVRTSSMPDLQFAEHTA